jgi:glucose-6-phosphate 1-dehydrogenase
LVVVIGASGDLAKKKTYPALFTLWKAHLLPKHLKVWGYARTVKSHHELHLHLRPYLLLSSQHDKGTKKEKEALVDKFLLNFCFYQAGKSYGEWPVMIDILKKNTPIHNMLVYLAVPPHVRSEATSMVRFSMKRMPDAVEGFTRIVLETPFGRDTPSSQLLLDALTRQKWTEDHLYRIDHYLGKEMLQNILVMRQSNPWLRGIWCKEMVQSVHIILKEPFQAHESRNGYLFDSCGIIRDVVQNHLLQILTLVAMELPVPAAAANSSSNSNNNAGNLEAEDVSMELTAAVANSSSNSNNAEAIRNAKMQVLKNIPEVHLQDCLLGQYDGYRNDPNITNPESIAPTYAAVKLNVNTPTWKGVPFVLEAGKALDEGLCEVRLHFHGSTESQPNALVMRLDPSPALYFCANIKTPGYSTTPVSTHVGMNYGASGAGRARASKIPDPYARLILDAVRGRQASFVRDDEVMAAWKIFTPILHETERDRVQPRPYQMGTLGPESRADFLQGVGLAHAWMPPASTL